MDSGCSEKKPVHPDRMSQPPKTDSDSGNKGLASCSTSNPAGMSGFNTSCGVNPRFDVDFPANHPLFLADSEERMHRDINLLNLPKLSPSELTLLKQNVGFFGEAYRNRRPLSEVCSSSFSNEYSSSPVESEDEARLPPKSTLDTMGVNYQIETDTLLKKLHDLKLGEDGEFVSRSKTDETLLSLLGEVMKLENQVKEKKEWAHQKAMQAARKLLHDLTELKMWRMEREENQQLMQEKSAAEAENAKIRADIEDSKLNAAESEAKCLEVSRTEKKHLKKLLAWEKKRDKLQEDITAEKQKLIQLQEEMLQVEAATKIAKAKWKEKLKVSEDAQAIVEEEKRLKISTEAYNKTLRSNIEFNLQRSNDDLQRLEHELSHLKTSTFQDQHLTKSYGSRPQDEANANMPDELNDSDEKHRIRRPYMICRKHKSFCSFLALCTSSSLFSCNVESGKKKAKCPACSALIEQRIRVF